MATDFRIRGGASAAQGLKSLTQANARVLLREIQAQIETPKGVKSGVLKLVNLRDRERNVTLERKSLWQRMFVRDGRDMQTTAEALKGVFERAGVSQDVLTQLNAYLEGRSNRAGTRTIARLIDSGLKTVGAVSGNSADDVLRQLGIERAAPGPKPESGSYGAVTGAERVGRGGRIYKEIPLYKADGAPNAAPLKLSEAPNSKGPPRLERSGATASAYIGRTIPGIVRPEVYVLTETEAGGTTRFHAVEGDKNLKNWAAQHLAANPGSKLHVTGVLMEEAQGNFMLGFVPETADDRAAFHSAALDGLKTLKQMAQRGFVHGDIKPDNAFVNLATGSAQFIDADNISKMRKGETGSVITAATLSYAHPLAFVEPYKAGFEHDLFGWGVSVLASTLPVDSEGKSRANDLVNAVTGYNLKDRGFWKANDQGYETLRANIRQVFNKPPAIELNKTQIMALNWIDAALDCSQPVSRRYGDPAQGRNAEHLLDQVDPSKHPRVARQLTRPLQAAAPQRAPAQQNIPEQQAQAPQQRQVRTAKIANAKGLAPGTQAMAAPPNAIGAAGNVAARPDVKDDWLKNKIDDRIYLSSDKLGQQGASILFPDNNLKLKTGNIRLIESAVTTWATGDGLNEIRTTLKGYQPNTKDYDRVLDDLIVRRMNIEHLRLLVSQSPDLSGVDDKLKTRFENRMNPISSDAPLLTTEQILDRIAPIRPQ